MKLINGVRYYTKAEVAELVGRSPQTVHLWDKWSEELEAAGRRRLIPVAFRADNGYRYWSEEDVEEIKEFALSVCYRDIADRLRTI